MQIPKYWANASGEVETPDGRTLQLKCWGWSTNNRQEAETKAREALDRLAARVRQGADLPSHYGYGTRALREEIIQEISGTDASPAAIVTRNSYGALILNTASLLFMDIDLPEMPKSSGGFFSKFKSPKTDPSAEALSKIQSQLDPTGIGFRVYRTAGGFRVVATDRPFEPGSRESEELLQRVGSDPSFIKLCRAQRSFRARLTPKPWRCGAPKPPVDFPRENSQEEDVFQQWLSDYESGITQWSTCLHVLDIGSSKMNEEARTLLDLHDRVTKASSNLPLA